MASPQKPVFSLAVTDPKWVRAYVPESDLGKLHPGANAVIVVDSFRTAALRGGWIYISGCRVHAENSRDRRVTNEPGL